LRQHALDGELTIYDPASQQAFFLNATATTLWDLIDGTTPEKRLVEALAELYQTNPETVAADVTAVLTQLDDFGLLEQRDPPRRRS
jgi:PqqD family protein of HPr-rel-A system